MSSEIVYSPCAVEDLDHIFDYIANDLNSPNAANKVVTKLLERIELLSNFPESGTPLQSICSIPNSYRFVTSGNYLAFYRYKDKVYVDRVLYGGSDYLKTLLGTDTQQIW